MKCPNCELGTIITITFKKNSEEAVICDYCQTVWLRGEEINAQTGKPFNMVRQGEDMEYMIEVSEHKDQEHRSVMYSDNK